MTVTNPSTAVTTPVAAATSNTTLFSAGRSVGRTVFNDSTATLYLKFGATASTSSYTVQITGGGYYEFPAPLYCGQVDGIWSAANGSAHVTSW